MNDPTGSPWSLLPSETSGTRPLLSPHSSQSYSPDPLKSACSKDSKVFLAQSFKLFQFLQQASSKEVRTTWLRLSWQQPYFMTIIFFVLFSHLP